MNISRRSAIGGALGGVIALILGGRLWPPPARWRTIEIQGFASSLGPYLVDELKPGVPLHAHIRRASGGTARVRLFWRSRYIGDITLAGSGLRWTPDLSARIESMSETPEGRRRVFVSFSC